MVPCALWAGCFRGSQLKKAFAVTKSRRNTLVWWLSDGNIATFFEYRERAGRGEGKNEVYLLHP